MLLTKSQYKTEPSNGQFQSGYYIRSNYYWNNDWNETESKYMIPFRKHPVAKAQVRFSLIIIEYVVECNIWRKNQMMAIRELS